MDDFIFGIRAVVEAIKANKNIDKVLIKTNLKGENISELMSLLKKNGIYFQYVPIEKINKIASGNHQGVLALISPIEYHNLEDIVTNTFESTKTPLLLLLENITDVRNFGAIARTAECAGVDAIIIATKGSARITADAIKTSAGALNSIPVCKENNLVDTVILLQQMGIKVFASSEKAAKTIYDEDFSMPAAIILGSEDKGISKSLQKKSDALVKIPIIGNIASLNVSVAAGIIIYEVLRKRKNFS